MSEEELKILNEPSDFESQKQILEEEKKLIRKKRRWFILISSIFLFIVLIFVVSYSTIYVYKEYGRHPVSGDICENVNIKVEGDKVPSINVSVGSSCKPTYNIDYHNNRVPYFNLDLLGNKELIFNKTNQMDEANNYCKINCDADDDGWPDYNIDLNGDGVPDINIVFNPKKGIKCDLNCDINNDMMPETNIDINGDNKPDINITGNDRRKPLYNIDYKGNKVPTFNVREDSGMKNPVISVKDNPMCKTNCDIDDDGWPDYNIVVPGSDKLLNELISSDTSKKIPYDKSPAIDTKCYNVKDPSCKIPGMTYANKYINIDINGDGIPDLNVSNDNGQTLMNEINKTTPDGKQKLNVDDNGDGFADYNIDTDNDNIPDLNIINDKNVCVRNCDTNHDGKADYLIGIGDKTFQLNEINIDYDYDGVCDLNCDKDGDLVPDYNIDMDSNSIPDINIDYDLDKISDYNIDTDGDGKADSDKSSEYEYYKTIDDQVAKTILTLDEKPSGDGGAFFVINPIDIKAADIDTGWNGKYVLALKNDTKYAAMYRLSWENVSNSFTTVNNLDYFMTRNGSVYLNEQKVPYRNEILQDNLLVKANTTLRYVVDVSFKETGVNQNIDSGKLFKGQFKVELIK